MELFDTPEIPIVLDEIRRVLSLGGRFGIVGYYKETGPSMILKIYEWAHERWPVFFDCRPIHVEESLRSAGHGTVAAELSRMAGFPVGIVVAEEIPVG